MYFNYFYKKIVALNRIENVYFTPPGNKDNRFLLYNIHKDKRMIPMAMAVWESMGCFHTEATAQFT